MPLVILTGSPLSEIVIQRPADIYSRPGDSPVISCLHNHQSYNQILWYKKSKNRDLQFLGYVYLTNHNPEKGVTVTMSGSANKGQNCTLTIPVLNIDNSTEYFCAASLHITTDHCSSEQKPPEQLYNSQLLAPVLTQ